MEPTGSQLELAARPESPLASPLPPPRSPVWELRGWGSALAAAEVGPTQGRLSRRAKSWNPLLSPPEPRPAAWALCLGGALSSPDFSSPCFYRLFYSTGNAHVPVCIVQAHSICNYF